MFRRSIDTAVTPSDNATFYRLATEGNVEGVEVFAVRVQWAAGHQASARLHPNGITGGFSPTRMTDLLAYKDPRTGLTPLMAAVTKGHLLVARMLLEYGAPVDATDLSKGRTALHKAMKASVNLTPLDARMINLLLDSGANPFACDNKGETAADYGFRQAITMGARILTSFDSIVQAILHAAIFSAPFEVRLNRFMGMPRGWRKMRCALVPYYPSVTSPVTELELLFIDEQVLTLVDLIRVTHSRAELCAVPGKLHMDLIVLRSRQIRRPMDVQMSSAGDQQLKLQLRALNESQAESSRLKNLVELAALDPGRAVEIATRRRGTRAPQSVANSSGSNVTEQSEDSARFMYNSRGVPRRHAVRLDGDQAERLNREDEQSGGEALGAVGTASASQGIVEASGQVNDVLAAARADYRNSSKLLAMRSDTARLILPWQPHEHDV